MRLAAVIFLCLLVHARADDNAEALLRRALAELRAATTQAVVKVDLKNPERVQVELSAEQAAALQQRAQLVADIEGHLQLVEKPKLRAQPKLRK